MQGFRSIHRHSSMLGNAQDFSASDGMSCGESWWTLSLALAFRKRSVENDAAESLQRRLGALDLTLIGIGSSVGAGIFVITGIAAVPTGPAVCFSFLLAGIGSLLTPHTSRGFHEASSVPCAMRSFLHGSPCPFVASLKAA